MALTVSSVSFHGRTEFTLGPMRLRIVDITFDASYPTNGEALTQAQLGFQSVAGVIQVSSSAAPPTVLAAYDVTNEKLKAYRWNLTVAGSAAVAGTDALSLKTGVINKESAGAGTEQTSFAEVENTADLSSTVIRLFVFGV